MQFYLEQRICKLIKHVKLKGNLYVGPVNIFPNLIIGYVDHEVTLLHLPAFPFSVKHNSQVFSVSHCQLFHLFGAGKKRKC